MESHEDGNERETEKAEGRQGAGVEALGALMPPLLHLLGVEVELAGRRIARERGWHAPVPAPKGGRG